MNPIKTTLIALTAILALSSSFPQKLPAAAKAPDFSLTGIDGKTHRLSDYKGKYVVLEWINHGCPFVKKHYNSKNMQTLQKEMTEKGIIWLSICSSALGKQGYYTPDEWKNIAAEKGMQSTAILTDESGKTGKLYNAKTTPHMFVINPKGELIYQGAIDDKPGTDLEDVPGAKNYVRQALDEAMSGKKVQTPKTQSYGCSVKYK